MSGLRQSAWLDTLALTSASMALYLLLAQEAFHGLDVHVHVFFLTQGHLEHPFHLLYMKIVGAAWPPLRALGLSPHHALRLLSAMGTAIGVACTHRAALRACASRALALPVAALAAAVPAVVFFATVAEIHGVFAAFAGVAWWTWAVFVGRRDVRAGVSMGLATGVAASVHATGHLLPIVFVLSAAAWSRSPSTRDGAAAPRLPWAGLVAAIVVHGLVAVGVALWLQPERLSAPFQGQVSFLRDSAGAHRMPWLANVWRVSRDEWLLALFPASILGPCAWLRRGRRLVTLAVCVGLLGYVGVTCLLLDDTNERGAYFLPMAFPLALLTAWALPRPRYVAMAALVGLATAYAQVRAHDHVGVRAWVRGFLALSQEQPVALICRDVDEQEAITRAQPDVPFVRVDSLMASADHENDYPQFCANFDAMAAQYRRAGRIVLITRPAYEAMLATGKPFFLRFLREHIAQHYQVDEVARDGFVALRVR